jgi:hypothetical protein
VDADQHTTGYETTPDVNRLPNMTQTGIVGDPFPPTEDTESIAHPPPVMGHLGADDGSIFDND